MSTEATQAHPRFALTTTVVLRETGGTAVLAKLKNISLSGCYLETPRQIAEGARVRVVLQVVDIHADVWGIVQRRDATGLGIRFTNGATVEDWKHLESFIRELHQTVASKSAAAPGRV
ncbi:MAG: PilZ domain-containing protein [Acidobacteriia bacterium]|nr:PilZ domain-containing protein [Terriglobia bacterium]